MYARMMQGTRHHKYIQWLAGYVALGWVAVEITFFTACRPFSGYWGVPPPNPQCTTYQHYATVQAVFNLSSDFGILLIPIPMIIQLSLPLKQKIVLGIVFSMGVFVVSAFLMLNRGYCTHKRVFRLLQQSSRNITTFPTSTTPRICSGTRAKPPSQSWSPTYQAYGPSYVNMFSSCTAKYPTRPEAPISHATPRNTDKARKQAVVASPRGPLPRITKL